MMSSCESKDLNHLGLVAPYIFSITRLSQITQTNYGINHGDGCLPASLCSTGIPNAQRSGGQ